MSGTVVVFVVCINVLCDIKKRKKKQYFDVKKNGLLCTIVAFYP